VKAPATTPATVIDRAPLKIVAFAGALQLGLALALPLFYQQLLGLSPEQTRATLLTGLGLAALVIGAESLFLARELARVHAAAGDPARVPEARRRAFALSMGIAGVLVACEVAGVTALGVGLFLTNTPAFVILRCLLCSSALYLLLPVPVRAHARGALLPLKLSLGDERTPEGAGWSLSTQLGYAIAAVACAALVPATVFGAAQLDRDAAADAQARARAAGSRLAEAARALEIQPATLLITRTPLAGGERVLYRAPSGVLLPEETALELAERSDPGSYVEVPLEGQLRGGALRVYWAAQTRARSPLVLLTLAMLLLTVALASSAGGSVAHDLRGLAHQIDRVASGEEPGALDPVATAEVERLARSVNRLLERIPRFSVESFVAIEHAQEASRMKSRFLANMSHDLRSPLNSILGFSELLLRGIEGELSPAQRDKLGVIQNRGNQLLRMLNEILDTAKVESGRMELHRQSAPPVELVRAALQEARRGRMGPGAQAAESADRVQISLKPGMQLLYVDPLRVTQAVTHLLNYALDAGGTGPILLSAAERADPAAPSGASGDGASKRAFVVELEEARPLGEDEAAHLFDGFRPGSVGGGLHLALPLARRLAELHGGTLELSKADPIRLRLSIPLSLPTGR
jgi:signal transduction histidine kinase